jgi:ribonuclease P protein component
MKKENIIQKNEDFAYLIKKTKPKYTKNFRFHILETIRENYRFGFSISKKYGNAVQRNLLRRRLKNFLTSYLISSGFDVVIMPKTTSKELSFLELEKEVIDFLKSVGVVTGEKK